MMGEVIPHGSLPGEQPAGSLFWRLAAGGLALLAVAAGCGNSEMGNVSGRITNGGKPVARVHVMLYTPNRPVARAVTDADGRYTLSTRRLNDGAYAGSHKVVLEPFIASADAPTSLRGGGIPADMLDLAKTPLEADVRAGTSNTCDLDIATPKSLDPK
jgi:hypothetical protein